jgi:predicted MarR family transcription regulator
MSSIDPAKIHMGATELERAVYDMQHEVICYIEAFYRYTGAMLARVTGDPNLSGQDCVILQGIRLSDRPKSIPEIRHFCNRSDSANIQYSIKKLIKAGLVEKTGNGTGRGTTYQVTDYGRDVTEEYVSRRRAFLSNLPGDAAEIEADAKRATRLLTLLTGLYDHESRSITGG